MTRLFIITTIALFSCTQHTQDKKNIAEPKQVETKKQPLLTIGEKIEGDFNGDGQIDTASAVKTKQGEGNPVENGTADEYEIHFSGHQLKPIQAGCCDIRLVNEGDLNNDGTDEFSIFQAPMNGCTSSMTTYTFAKGTWQQMVETFLIPTNCDYLSDDDLQKRIFKENNVIYYYDIDPNDESRKLIKKKATSLTNNK